MDRCRVDAAPSLQEAAFATPLPVMKNTETEKRGKKRGRARKNPHKKASVKRTSTARKLQENGESEESAAGPKLISSFKGEEFWEMEKIIGRRVKKGRTEYLIRWKGCPESDNSWEPASNLCDSALADALKFAREERQREKQWRENERILGLCSGWSCTSEETPSDHLGANDKSFGEVKRGSIPFSIVSRASSSNSERAHLESNSSAVSSDSYGRIQVDDQPSRIDVDKSDKACQELEQSPSKKFDEYEQVIRVSPPGQACVEQFQTFRVDSKHGGKLHWVSTPSATDVVRNEQAYPEPKQAMLDPKHSEHDLVGSEPDSGNCNAVHVQQTPRQKVIENCDDPWLWNDAEQVVFREVRRINVHDENARYIITEARENGTPVVLTGHVGWANFAKRWLSKSYVDTDTAPAKEAVTPDGEDEWLDLAKPHKLNVEAMIEDIGSEDVPVVRRDYNEEHPIHCTISASTFLKTSWPNSKGDLSGASRVTQRLYLHQWQFPLSDTAGRKLCHQNNPLPNNILGEDMLKYWIDLPQCKLDCPLQYLFMGREETLSKLHQDPGGLAISIAPIVGEKECVLVHRADGVRCLDHLQASLEHICLNKHHLVAHARIWKTTVHPGEILLMPQGTYHQCRNVTPCLSYSRFHLDTVNLVPFLYSMINDDAPEIEHDWVIWNCASELIKKVDKFVDEARSIVLARKKLPPPSDEMVKLVDTTRALRNVVCEVARRVSVYNTTMRSTCKILGKRDKYPWWYQSDGPEHDWDALVDDMDLCLHEIRYRHLAELPPFRRRRSKARDTAFDAKSKRSFPDAACDTESTQTSEMTEEHSSTMIDNDVDLEKVFLRLPRVSQQDVLVEESFEVSVGDTVAVQLLGKKLSGEVLEIQDGAPFALVSFEELPSFYDEFLNYDKLRIPTCDGIDEVREQDIEHGMVVVLLDKGGQYRGVVQATACEEMFRIRLNLASTCQCERWLSRTYLLQNEPVGASNKSSCEPSGAVMAVEKCLPLSSLPVHRHRPGGIIETSCEGV